MARFVLFLLCPNLVHLNQRDALQLGGKYRAVSKNSSQASPVLSTSDSHVFAGDVLIFDDHGQFWTQQVAFDSSRCTSSGRNLVWDWPGADAKKDHVDLFLGGSEWSQPCTGSDQKKTWDGHGYHTVACAANPRFSAWQWNR